MRLISFFVIAVFLPRSFSAHAGEEQVGAGMQIGPPAIESVEWVAMPGNQLDDNPNAGGGKRIFPGKQQPDENAQTAANRRKVKMKVTLATVPDRDCTVHLASYDVDDPSANAAPVDDEATTQDNRGSVGRSKAGRLQNATLAFEANGDREQTTEFEVTMQPGDNFRVVASLNNALLARVNVPQDNTTGELRLGNGPLANNDQVAATEMLTVWRKLHIEHDSMEQEGTTPLTKDPDMKHIIVEDVLLNTPVQGQITFDTYGPIFSPEVDHYEGGGLRVRVNIGGIITQYNFSVLTNTANGFFGDQIVVIGNLTQAQAITLKDHIGVLYDDDPLTPQLPYYHNLSGFVTAAFQPAYIQIELMGSDLNPNPTVPFITNISEAGQTLGRIYDNSQDRWSQTDFWCSLLVTCYQGEKEGDGDPDIYTGLNNVYVTGGGDRRQPFDVKSDQGATPSDDDNASIFSLKHTGIWDIVLDSTWTILSLMKSVMRARAIMKMVGS